MISQLIVKGVVVFVVVIVVVFPGDLDFSNAHNVCVLSGKV